MKLKIIKKLLSISSFSGILLFFVLANSPNIPYIEIKKILGSDMSLVVKDFIYIGIVVFFAWLVLLLTKTWLSSNDTIKVTKIKPAESTFLPAYIGLFVIALELNSSFTLETIIMLSIIFIFWIFLENISYFNPFFLLFGYRFYEVESNSNNVFTIITKKKDIKQIKEFNNLIRITNFTFLEK